MQTQLRNLTSTILISTATLLVNACGQSTHEASSETKVTNGQKVSESEHPSVVLLVMQSPAGSSICTGTFVNDHQVVTAGHCVESLQKSNPKMYIYKTRSNGTRGTVKATGFVRNPLYSITDQNGVNGNDLAVVNFPADTAPAVSVIASESPEINSELTIVGYGNNSNYFAPDGQMTGSGSGEKRSGTNELRVKKDGFLTFYGLPGSAEDIEAGQWVASGSGDSGGPMFIKGELVGVTSGGGLATTKDDVIISVANYVDLNSEVSRAFLDQHLDR